MKMRFLVFIIFIIIVISYIFLFYLNSDYSLTKNTGDIVNSLIDEDGMDGSIDQGVGGELDCEDCNVIMISLTNTRKDHLGIYGYSKNTTPNIDAFFKNSIIFNEAFAPASWTLPVIASLFSSEFPYSHGVMDRYDGSGMLDDKVLTLAELLKEDGYKTAAFTGGGDHSSIFNFNQGFDVYQEGGGNGPRHYAGINQSIFSAIDWLKNNKNDNFFLLLQGYDTHCPFTPKQPYDKMFDPDYEGGIDFSLCLWTFEKVKPIYENDKKYWPLKSWYSGDGIKDVNLTDNDVEHMVSLYDGEIAQADNTLKDFFTEIENFGLDKNTIIIFMSEHGDLFGEHGRFMRGGPLRGTFYDQVLNFPLLIKHPKIDNPIYVDSLVQTVDIMPTLLDIMNIKDPQAELRQGKSATFSIINQTDFNDQIYAASKFTPSNSNVYFSESSTVEVIRDNKWKLIKEKIFKNNENLIEDMMGNSNLKQETQDFYELYNIEDDPKEENNLYGTNKKITEKLKKDLEKWTDKFD
jgi:choline-sulfatase